MVKVIQPLGLEKEEVQPAQAVVGQMLQAESQAPQLNAEPVVPTLSLPPQQPAGQNNYPDSQGGVPVGVSASSLGLINQSTPLPKGVYVLVVLILAEVILSFFSRSSSTSYFTVVMVIDLFLAVGLLTRLNVVRKLLIGLQIISLILAVLVVFGLAALQTRANENLAKVHQATEKIATDQTGTADQRQKIQVVVDRLDKQKADTDQIVKRAHVAQSITVVITVSIIFYLTRPGVKDAFHD